MSKESSWHDVLKYLPCALSGYVYTDKVNGLWGYYYMEKEDIKNRRLINLLINELPLSLKFGYRSNNALLTMNRVKG